MCFPSFPIVVVDGTVNRSKLTVVSSNLVCNWSLFREYFFPLVLQQSTYMSNVNTSVLTRGIYQYCHKLQLLLF